MRTIIQHGTWHHKPQHLDNINNHHQEKTRTLHSMNYSDKLRAPLKGAADGFKLLPRALSFMSIQHFLAVALLVTSLQAASFARATEASSSAFVPSCRAVPSFSSSTPRSHAAVLTHAHQPAHSVQSTLKFSLRPVALLLPQHGSL